MRLGVDHVRICEAALMYEGLAVFGNGAALAELSHMALVLAHFFRKSLCFTYVRDGAHSAWI